MRDRPLPPPNPPAYAELQAISNFSFLEGGSHPDELVAEARVLGLSALGLADRNTVAGVVRAHTAAKELGLRFLPGSRLELVCGTRFLCYPTDRAAWGRLCRLLSEGQLRAPKGQCHLTLDDVAAHAEGQVLIALPPCDWHWQETLAPVPPLASPSAAISLEARLRRIKAALPRFARLYLAASHSRRGDDRARLAALAHLANRTRIPLVATGDVLYHAPHRRPLQDVLTAIRLKTTVAEAGSHLAPNAERHLQSPARMARLFAGCEEAVARTLDIVAACRFSLDDLAYEYPDEPVPAGTTPQDHLETLTWQGARRHFPDGVPAKVEALIRRELDLIRQLGYAPYFLTVNDIVAFARSQQILAQGRGSAANSAVCYVLGITAVNPTEIDVLFERFVSPERKEPPDIDVDFEHERREEVIQYIYRRYGRHRAGLAATVISYRARSAVREVGKAMGLAEDTVAALAGMVWGTRSGGPLPERHVREAGLDPADPLLARVIELAAQLSGFPRHLSQHVGGFVLTRGPLIEVVPVGNAAMADRTFIEWDKDDLAALGLLKVDVLALGMLTCIRKAFDLVARHEGRELTLASVPREDPAVYDMLCDADSLGVFQVESRAQMNMLPRLRPRRFYDLVIEVAIVRPGPIQGDMVHPYLKRRSGEETVTYPSPAPAHGDRDELERILRKTLGVPLFQEQAMRIAMSAARFSDGDVNELRKAMATFRRRGTIGRLEEKMVEAMVARGYERAFAERCFNQIKGFGEYGFPESHAASFAHLVYVSSWLKRHHPAAFAAALLNSQPMGFYAPAQIVRDAAEHGVELRPPDVGHSAWDATLEPPSPETSHAHDAFRRSRRPAAQGWGRSGPALRLGLRQVDGLQEAEGRRIVAARLASFHGSCPTASGSDTISPPSTASIPLPSGEGSGVGRGDTRCPLDNAPGNRATLAHTNWPAPDQCVATAHQHLRGCQTHGSDTISPPHTASVPLPSGEGPGVGRGYMRCPLDNAPGNRATLAHTNWPALDQCVAIAHQRLRGGQTHGSDTISPPPTASVPLPSGEGSGVGRGDTRCPLDNAPDNLTALAHPWPAAMQGDFIPSRSPTRGQPLDPPEQCADDHNQRLRRCQTHGSDTISPPSTASVPSSEGPVVWRDSKRSNEVLKTCRNSSREESRRDLARDLTPTSSGPKKSGGPGEPSPARAWAAAHSRSENPHPSAPPFADLHDLRRRAGVTPATLERLAAADAMRSLGLDRRQALWQVKGLEAAAPLPLFAWSAARETGPEPAVELPALPLSEHVVCDYQTLRLSLKAHPVSFLRAGFAARRVLACADLARLRDGAAAAVAGVVLVRQRPGSAKGVVFMTIEDETGIANVVVWPKTLERYRRQVMTARLMLIRGRIQCSQGIVHLVSATVEDESHLLATLAEDALPSSPLMPVPIANADEVLRPDPGSWRSADAPNPRRHPRDHRIIPRSRDFH